MKSITLKVKGKNMYSQVQSAWKKRCRELKRAGYTIAQISEKLRLSQATVGRYVRGLADQREIREKPTEPVFPTIPGPNVKNTENADGDGISYNSQCRGLTYAGVWFLLVLGIVGVVILILDHFVFKGKIFAWVFGELKLQNPSQGTGEKFANGCCDNGFEGESLSNL